MEPGWIHKALADNVLRGFRNRFQSETGEAFNIGKLDHVEDELSQLTDGSEPVDLLARIIAHLGHRIPGVRRVEKRLEGSDPKSGFGSDLLALGTILYLRNREVLERAARTTREKARAAQAAKQNGTTPEESVEFRVPEGVT